MEKEAASRVLARATSKACRRSRFLCADFPAEIPNQSTSFQRSNHRLFYQRLSASNHREFQRDFLHACANSRLGLRESGPGPLRTRGVSMQRLRRGLCNAVARTARLGISGQYGQSLHLGNRAFERRSIFKDPLPSAQLVS